MFEDYFSFQIFFIFLRESLEIIVIISILITVVRQALGIKDETKDPATEISNNVYGTSSSDETTVDQGLSLEEEEELYDFPREVTDEERTANVNEEKLKRYKSLKFQIWSGGILGLVLCFIIGGTFIVVFYHIGRDLWSLSEHYYEGILSIIASVIMSVMGLFFLRMGKLREKFRVKLAGIIYSDQGKFLKEQNKAVTRSGKYAFFILPFFTTLREGLEAVVFIGGVGIDQPLTSIPLSMLAAVTISGILGYYFFKYSSSLSLKICLSITTCFMYLIAAGLFSKGVWQLELQDYVNKCNGQDMAEVGNGPGSYDISKSVWHVNCCNGERDGFWMLLTAIFGWTNSATYGSVISYIIYWLCLIVVINVLIEEEKYGYIPYIPISWQKDRIIKRIKVAKASIDMRQIEVTNGVYRAENHALSKDSTTPLIPQ
ncbi:iron transporter Fth1p [Monosporozyma unispora]|nr:fts3-like protein [Kazachstania unispora]